MNYQESIEYLTKCQALGSKPGLDRITELLRRLGNPQDGLRIIHLAGTNGKGSVGCFLQTVLKEAGYCVGFFTSPYLFHHREMISIDGADILEEDFAWVLTLVQKQADAMEEDGFFHPTEFEIMTATAYLFFHEKRCDFVIAEAGMGGGGDATNVMHQTEVSVLTRIDYDHVQFLGDTLSEITREKCGIFRKDCPAVIYPFQEAETLSVIQKEAQKRGTVLVLPLLDAIVIEKTDVEGSVFSYGKMKQIQISMCGRHQVYNAVTALSVLLVLKQRGADISEEAMYRGMYKAKWAGRFELLSKEPPIVLDGAHNLNGVKAFKETVLACFPKQSFIGVVGMLRDKDFKASLLEFGKICDKLILTEVPNSRTAKAEELLAVAEELGISAQAVKKPEEAVMQAFKERKAGEGILCVGSLYALSTFQGVCQKNL